MNRKELNRLLHSLGIFKSKQLDSNLGMDDDTHFTDYSEKTNEIITDELNETELQIALMAKQTEYLKSIKSMLTFFMVVVIIGIVIVTLGL